MSISIREPCFSDEPNFIHASLRSKELHHPWTTAPCTHEAFFDYITRFSQPNNKSFLAMVDKNKLIGVFNLSNIVRGCFQNAYFGYYAFQAYAGQGLMSQALKLVLAKAFDELKLHRIEANIQPENLRSIYLVKKNGFRHEGFSPHYLNINGEWRDHERFAMTIEDWQVFRNASAKIKGDTKYGAE